MKCIKHIIVTLIFTVPASACLEDIINPLVVKYDNASDLITYVETSTPLLKGSDFPFYADVDEVHQNLSNYLIIDLRTPDLFTAGHIPSARNLDKSALLEYFQNSDLTRFNKIVLVSNTGQLASYTACLMIIAGIKNIYVLDQGMTYWHEDLSQEYKNARGLGKWWSTYTLFSESIKPPKLSQPPKVEFSDKTFTIEGKIQERVQMLLEKQNNNLFISASKFSDSYNPETKWYNGNYVVYTAINDAGYLHGKGDEDIIVAGPQTAVLYIPPWQFRADRDLLTLRQDKNIVMYSPTGQISSFWQAYLHLLGYDKAITIRYGSISIMGFAFELQRPIRDSDGNIIRWISQRIDLTRYFFDEEKVRNYSVESGP